MIITSRTVQNTVEIRNVSGCWFSNVVDIDLLVVSIVDLLLDVLVYLSCNVGLV